MGARSHRGSGEAFAHAVICKHGVVNGAEPGNPDLPVLCSSVKLPVLALREASNDVPPRGQGHLASFGS